METYIIRFYRETEDRDNNKSSDILGVIEVAGHDTMHYFSSIDELLATLHQLCVAKPA